MHNDVQDFTRLQHYYKGKLTENALLNKAGRLAAEQHLIMNNPNMSPSMAVKMVKPMAREEGKLVKRLRTGTSDPITYQGTAEPEGMDAPVENLLKQILKGVKQEPAAPIIIIQETPSTSGIKKEKKSPKPFTSKKTAPSTSKKSDYSESTQKILRSLGLDDDGGYSPKGAKGKKPKKAKKTLQQKLQEGWEEWDKPSKRKLEKETRIRTRTKKPPPLRKRTRRGQRGYGLDIQKWLSKTGIEFHWPGYQYMGPGTKLKKRLARGKPGINRLDRLAKQHDIDYSKSKNLQDKWKADAKMIQGIDKLPGRKSVTERIVKKSCKPRNV